MATTVTDTTSTTTTSSSTYTNPNAELDKDAFLQLLLTELQYQDPTDPMDTETILTQTAQLSSLEMQQNTNETMEAMVNTMEYLADSMGTAMSTSALAAIGKMATIEDNTVTLTGSDDVITLKMYLPEDTDENGVTLEVYDSNGNLVYNESVDGQLFSGINSIVWYGKNNDGIYAGNGDYTVKLVYNNADGEKITAEYGSYLIEGIRFVDGVAYAQMADQYVLFNEISLVYDYK
ncbi:flagellar basal body rod modification protein [Campylobacter sp. LR291e]|nr:flagellar basal body rod modification protein [Campylobacter sp. LR185c]KAA6231419.1 flagellar basal body rod modification protein [Campylobacter sp. LR264d]KAA6231631.1 flagellar basal body rod modification protein [Campylobacter sp. LR291e]KAA8604716.1 flagellar basal body rod modification protein [Campylobacter sp. LR185c]